MIAELVSGVQHLSWRSSGFMQSEKECDSKDVRFAHNWSHLQNRADPHQHWLCG